MVSLSNNCMSYFNVQFACKDKRCKSKREIAASAIASSQWLVFSVSASVAWQSHSKISFIWGNTFPSILLLKVKRLKEGIAALHYASLHFVRNDSSLLSSRGCCFYSRGDPIVKYGDCFVGFRPPRNDEAGQCFVAKEGIAAGQKSNELNPWHKDIFFI